MINQGTKLNPSVYTTIIPDQYKTGAQKNDIGKSIMDNFIGNNKISFATDPNTQPIRTFSFIRTIILNSINA